MKRTHQPSALKTFSLFEEISGAKVQWDISIFSDKIEWFYCASTPFGEDIEISNTQSIQAFLQDGPPERGAPFNEEILSAIREFIDENISNDDF